MPRGENREVDDKFSTLKMKSALAARSRYEASHSIQEEFMHKREKISPYEYTFTVLIDFLPSYEALNDNISVAWWRKKQWCDFIRHAPDLLTMNSSNCRLRRCVLFLPAAYCCAVLKQKIFMLAVSPFAYSDFWRKIEFAGMFDGINPRQGERK